MVDPVTLESVLSAFDKWRQYRCSPKESVPKELREQAISLLMQHTQSRVATTLKISHVMLKKWRPKSAPMQAMFMVLPAETTNADRSETLQITLRNVHGVEMRIVGDITSDLVLRLANSFASSSGVGA
jgi:hypothetical protein